MRKSFVFKFLALVFGLCSIWTCSSRSERLETLIPDARKDAILFASINEATDLAGQPQLRNVRLPEGDIEARIWRGFGLDPLEGVLVKRNSGQWSGIHLKTDRYYDAQKVDSRVLNPPTTGWDSFWQKLVDEGLTTIQQNSVHDCDIPNIDGIGYVVELNSGQTYRYYFYPEAHPKCEEARKTAEIGEIIGLEFDSGYEKCERTEWFPCMTYRKQHER